MNPAPARAQHPAVGARALNREDRFPRVTCRAGSPRRLTGSARGDGLMLAARRAPARPRRGRRAAVVARLVLRSWTCGFARWDIQRVFLHFCNERALFQSNPLYGPLTTVSESCYERTHGRGVSVSRKRRVVYEFSCFPRVARRAGSKVGHLEGERSKTHRAGVCGEAASAGQRPCSHLNRLKPTTVPATGQSLMGSATPGKKPRPLEVKLRGRNEDICKCAPAARHPPRPDKSEFQYSQSGRMRGQTLRVPRSGAAYGYRLAAGLSCLHVFLPVLWREGCLYLFPLSIGKVWSTYSQFEGLQLWYYRHKAKIPGPAASALRRSPPSVDLIEKSRPAGRRSGRRGRRVGASPERDPASLTPPAAPFASYRTRHSIPKCRTKLLSDIG
ncbi:hypothetical protein EVAR_38367_1 [Eumeta japonica]|uniref:Uncharacterized protein n=1 Tax=Eumeta variegata TaxID=151549 RepID=A0A4C1Y011_EUMVA|nr:hypothetical protein EVAR_38367_1 [Eumeta japonica]